MTTTTALALFWLVALGSLLLGGIADLFRAHSDRNGRAVVLRVSVFYPSAFVEAFEGDMDIVAGVMRMMLLIGDHTEDPDDDFVNDISADEATDASYGRVTLANDAIVYDSANDRAEYDFDDVVFASLANTTVTEAAAYLRVGADDTTPADDPLLALWDIADTVADGSDFTLQPGTEGAIQFS